MRNTTIYIQKVNKKSNSETENAKRTHFCVHTDVKSEANNSRIYGRCRPPNLVLIVGISNYETQMYTSSVPQPEGMENNDTWIEERPSVPV